MKRKQFFLFIPPFSGGLSIHPPALLEGVLFPRSNITTGWGKSGKFHFANGIPPPFLAEMIDRVPLIQYLNIQDS